jgi:hypothetical protein
MSLEVVLLMVFWVKWKCVENHGLKAMCNNVFVFVFCFFFFFCKSVMTFLS